MSNINISELSLSFDTDNYRTSIKSLLKKKKSNDNSSVFKALDSVTLEIKTGERVGIIGPNGSGKSTLLKVISRIYEVYDGSVDINGEIAALLEIGAGFVPELTGRENIYLNCSLLGLNRKQTDDIIESIIDFSNLRNFIDNPIKTYSTGMHTRLAFTIATSINPEILILDEIFAGGDFSFINKAKHRLEDFMGKAKIMIVVSHDLSLISKICTRLILMDKGKIIQDGKPSEVIEKYKKNYS